ncbi:MAG: hypothetical protein A2Z14_10900 [Chloroflexi bacterium RBG_16_48_8]|nr:MAG: hypothetical protein A2Z14_10900 [Chloroflexi bacterium RBG_16_48_8]
MTDPKAIDQLVIIVASGYQPSQLQECLIREGFTFTEMESSSGLLQEPRVCLLVGLNHDRLSSLLEMIRKTCKPIQQYVPIRVGLPEGYAQVPMIEVQVGGATVYLLNIERFEQF